MPDLILRPSGRADPAKAWSLQLRYHESYGPAEYFTIARVSEATAREIIRAGAPFWLFGDPDERHPVKEKHNAEQ